MYTVAIQGNVWGLVILLYCSFYINAHIFNKPTNDCIIFNSDTANDPAFVLTQRT